MEIHQLNIFIHVARIKNFTQVGRILGYSQSNISAQIQQLEKEIGAPLFNRIGRKVSLTQYGEELLPYAQEIVSTAIRMENFLKSDEAMGGTVKVGIVESLFELVTEKTITNYHSRFPNVRIELTVDGTANLKEMLQQGTLDLACLIDDAPSKAEWNCWHVIDVPIVIIANSNYNISKKDNITLRDLKDEEFILMEQSARYTIYFKNKMTETDIKFHSVLKLQSASMACRLVENGHYLSVLPLYSVVKSAEQGKVRILNVEDFSHTQYVQTILHPNKVIIPQIEGFLEELYVVLEDVVSV
ncbi:MAG: LysR family transcriptional regulator [Tissierellaceae bacterium]|nr:LysR family transcriptional regulator [Tissierellaceae bacterium]